MKVSFNRKNPVLLSSLVLFAFLMVYLANAPRDRGHHYTCFVIQDALEKQMPSNWTIKCDKNDLNVTIDSHVMIKTDADLQKTLYSDLARDLKFIAKFSPNDVLDSINLVIVLTKHSKMDILAVAKGQTMQELGRLEKQDDIDQLFQREIKVKEHMK